MTILSLDLGTTTITGVLWGGQPARVLRLARRRNDAGIQAGSPLRAEQDPQRLEALAREVLAELAARAEAGDPPQALALTGQMHGLLCADAAGEPLGPLITWQDRRTAEPPNADAPSGGATAMDRLQARLADLDWRANGCRIRHGYGAATLFWLSSHDALPPGTRWVSPLAGWLAGRLVGQAPAIDPSFAASWGLYDLRPGRWNEAFLDRLEIDRRLLPGVRPTAEPVGRLLPAVARRTGLPAGLPVLNPVGDNQAAYLGSTWMPGAAGQPGTPTPAILVNLGTGGQVGWAVPAWQPPGEAVETRPLPLPGGDGAGTGFLRVGASLCGGAAWAWLERTVRAWLAEFGLEIDAETAYGRLNDLAAACADTQGLRVRTTFLGARDDPGVEGGAIEGITLDNLSLGALARATLAGMVDELYRLYAAHGGPQAGADHVVAAGGAVERNPLLLELIEERFRT
ncbi:MAG: FGGY family carbohydrate kinase, partial [Anaerolineae bacterium]